MPIAKGFVSVKGWSMLRNMDVFQGAFIMSSVF